MEVINAALPYIDVLSFQDFRDPVKHLQEWHKKTDKPVLLADGAGIKWQTAPGEFTRNEGTWYAEMLEGLLQKPWLHRYSSLRCLSTEQSPALWTTR